jgi:hypothetical protein
VRLEEGFHGFPGGEDGGCSSGLKVLPVLLVREW